MAQPPQHFTSRYVCDFKTILDVIAAPPDALIDEDPHAWTPERPEST